MSSIKELVVQHQREKEKEAEIKRFELIRETKKREREIGAWKERFKLLFQPFSEAIEKSEIIEIFKEVEEMYRDMNPGSSCGTEVYAIGNFRDGSRKTHKLRVVDGELRSIYRNPVSVKTTKIKDSKVDFSFGHWVSAVDEWTPGKSGCSKIVATFSQRDSGEFEVAIDERFDTIAGAEVFDVNDKDGMTKKIAEAFIEQVRRMTL